MDLEYRERILTLKKAAVVLDAIADRFDGEELKSQTKSLAWGVSWAVEELTKQNGAKND